MSLSTRMLPPPRWCYGLAFIACAAAIGCGLYLQYVLRLEPCPLCIFQRVAIMSMGFVFLVAAIHNPGAAGRRAYAVVLALLGICGIGLALRHLWIQSQPPGTVPACGMGLDYMLQTLPVGEVIQKVLRGGGECAKIDRVFGLQIPMWTLLFFIALAALGIGLARRPRSP